MKEENIAVGSTDNKSEGTIPQFMSESTVNKESLEKLLNNEDNNTTGNSLANLTDSKETIDGKYATINFGPTHPATHGIFQNILKVDGEKIISSEQTVGYIHRAFEKLAEKWGKKHAGAMYVKAHKYLQEPGPLASHYSFGPQVYCGQGTSALLFLKAIGLGAVYLDPGDRVNEQGEEKKRTQWRVSKGRGVNFDSTLAPLYDSMQIFEI